MRALVIAFVAVGLVFGVSSASFAKGNKKSKGADAAFNKADTNNDGKISLAEFEAAHKAKGKGKGKGKGVNAVFAKLDKDNDGFLSKAEFAAAKKDGKKKKK